MKNREDLIGTLKSYSTNYPDEKIFIPRFLELLRHPRSFHRDHLPGHITASAWIVDESRKHVLLTHHAKLNRWLQPGGHADGDEDVLRVAIREAQEETGLTSLTLLNEKIFDIDIHTIPAGNSFPEHDHYDIRILLNADRNERYIISEESHDLAWLSLADVHSKVGADSSVLRLVQKIR
jgi:8-oxo-dGTP pyrophosphatase MutT (NUDIX family)